MYIQLIQSTIDPAIEDQASRISYRGTVIRIAQLYSFFFFFPERFLQYSRILHFAHTRTVHTDLSKSASVIAIKFSFFFFV